MRVGAPRLLFLTTLYVAVLIVAIGVLGGTVGLSR
jgi:hypothetical protein